jgi:molybdenum cofactor synthesis domain-containing protein
MKTAAVFTISDSTYAGIREDRSGPAVRKRLEEQGWHVSVLEVIPDDAARISERLRAVAYASHVGAIFTTGGTGVAARDVTPEATRAVIDREIPGLAEAMRSEGRRSTLRASLSRALAGTRGSVLIVNLPGSPQGALESLNAILEVVPHVLDLLGGRTEHSALPERSHQP